ncbi:MAG TPA: maleylpyruvate isomerase family mycothiol-dependent enzyme [Jatrophihabitans sp.]|jgi:uncharacterized protein (TIGR03083 family)
MTSSHPSAADLDFPSIIATESAALASAAEGNLDAQVQHCPAWTVADLVAHVYGVHWFWGTVAAEQRNEPPSDDERPPRPADDVLITEFRAGARRLVETLAAADQSEQVWTWAPSQQDIAFITRHQVQEMAVHRWDAQNAAAGAVPLDSATAVDSIEEFLTFSVSSVSDHPDEPRPSLAGSLVLTATDIPAIWTVHDAALPGLPGTVAFERGSSSPDVPVVTGSASDLLLWLYGRRELAVTGQDGEQIVARFRNLCFTD